jgi:hypothetical protein
VKIFWSDGNYLRCIEIELLTEQKSCKKISEVEIDKLVPSQILFIPEKFLRGGV